VTAGGSVSLDAAQASRDELFRQLRERILRFAASRVARDVAEDLSQEVLLLLATKYAALSAAEDLVPLAFRIVRFKIMGYRRKALRHGEIGPGSSGDHPADWADPVTWHGPEEQLRRRELSDRLASAVQQLTGRCRTLLRLKLEGHRFADIQQAMGARTINTVYTWDARCRERLLQLMGGAWEH
jgi:RNA polymerase sigma-70 factor, ECF subfamily